jgi:hypothetical protein
MAKFTREQVEYVVFACEHFPEKYAPLLGSNGPGSYARLKEWLATTDEPYWYFGVEHDDPTIALKMATELEWHANAVLPED